MNIGGLEVNDVLLYFILYKFYNVCFELIECYFEI